MPVCCHDNSHTPTLMYARTTCTGCRTANCVMAQQLSGHQTVRYTAHNETETQETTSFYKTLCEWARTMHRIGACAYEQHWTESAWRDMFCCHWECLNGRPGSSTHSTHITNTLVTSGLVSLPQRHMCFHLSCSLLFLAISIMLPTYFNLCLMTSFLTLSSFVTPSTLLPDTMQDIRSKVD